MHAEVLSCRFRGRPPLITISFLLLHLVLAGRYSARSSRGSLCSANDPDDLLEAQRHNRENIRDRTIRRRRNGECLAFDRPETIAAIIAGLPYATALTASEAYERMRGQGIPKPRELGDRVLAASIHSGLWPAISVCMERGTVRLRSMPGSSGYAHISCVGGTAWL
jgi:hypothetical protein